MGYIKGVDRDQIILFQECIDDYISEDSPVRVIEEHEEQLDIWKLGCSFKNYTACKKLRIQERCTRGSKDRIIFRHADQDFLDTIELQAD